jgi:hypothetical protein
MASKNLWKSRVIKLLIGHTGQMYSFSEKKRPGQFKLDRGVSTEILSGSNRATETGKRQLPCKEDSKI